jgi:hypothetical protein
MLLAYAFEKMSAFWQHERVVDEVNPGEMIINGAFGQAVAREPTQQSYEVERGEIPGALVGDIHRALVEQYRRTSGAANLNDCGIDELEDDYLGNVVISLLVDLGEKDDLWPYNSITFDLIDDQTTALCLCLYETRNRDGRAVTPLIRSVLSRQGMSFIHCRFVDDHTPDTLPFWSVALIPRHSSTVADMFELRGMLDLLTQIPLGDNRGRASHRLTWQEAKQVLFAGFPAYLIGQVESSWLEVKSRAYVSGPGGEIELSQDVARFANGDGPGLLAIGFREETKHGAKVIGKITPLPARPGISAIYHRILDRRVYPPVRDLQVEEIPFAGGVVIVLALAKQRDEDKPFLVTGAMIDGKCEGAFISIVRRRGEHSIPITPADIHAALSAGRAAIQLGGRRTRSDLSGESE